jgi:hypothetical protein
VADPVARFPESGFRNPASLFEAIDAIWEAGSYPAPRTSSRIFEIANASHFRLRKALGAPWTVRIRGSESNACLLIYTCRLKLTIRCVPTENKLRARPPSSRHRERDFRGRCRCSSRRLRNRRYCGRRPSSKHRIRLGGRSCRAVGLSGTLGHSPMRLERIKAHAIRGIDNCLVANQIILKKRGDLSAAAPDVFISRGRR